MSVRCLLVVFCLLAQLKVAAQQALVAYSDSLLNGFQDWSWAPDNLANTSHVYSGANSISVSPTNFWEALWLYHPSFSTGPYASLSFAANGGATGGQVLQVEGVQIQNGNGVGLGASTVTLTTNWQEFTIPLSTLGIANLTNCNGVWFQVSSAGNLNTFYIDAVQLLPATPPAVYVTANAGQIVRTADSRWFGVNTAVWDGYFDDAETVSQINEAGWQIMRFPGGSLSDEYNWATDTSGTNTWQWVTSFDDFAQVAKSVGTQAVITANYGTGTAAEAAAWVKYSNITNHYGFKYWEVGNEVYGSSWETDSNTYPHDPYTYATRAQAYIQQMKAADPTVKVGVVVTTGEDNDSNGYNSHPATNSSTHQVHYGWTPVLLSTLKSLGVTPDFAIYHWYPEYIMDDDTNLLAGSTNWIGDAANLRGMISNYFGAGGSNIELLVTENNSDSGPNGKQSTSLVNALYMADSFGNLMQTEFNSFIWWDLRNGPDTNGDFSPSLYGWRTNGDLGVMNGQGTSLVDRYPAYFSAKLMKYFIRGGDSVLSTTSDFSLLDAFAGRRTNGSLTLLVINKDLQFSLAGQIALPGFAPSPGYTVYSYGMPQDNAAEAGNAAGCDIAQTNLTMSSTNVSYTFAPYSLTVFAFAPVAPSVSVLPSAPGTNQLVLKLSGTPGTPYVLQNSTDLLKWTSVSTNLISTNFVNITNTINASPTAQFWRAVWVP